MNRPTDFRKKKPETPSEKLKKLGLSSGKTEIILEHFGEENILPILELNPYMLCDASGVSFTSIDKIFLEHLNGSKQDPRRLTAALRIEIETACKALGHTAVTEEEICNQKGELRYTKLRWSEINHLIGKGFYQESEKTVAAFYRETSEGVGITTPKLLEQEETIALFLRKLASKPLSIKNPHLDPKLNVEQKTAVSNALNHPVSILTGGPGTGKTTTLECILSNIGKEETWLCAFTGNAAQRMEHKSGQKASTIHSLIGQLRSPQPPKFKNIIIDEASTVSCELLAELVKELQKFPKLERLVLIGDEEQLPAIGEGRILGDLIDSQLFPTTTLTQVMRVEPTNQLADSLTSAAQKIRKGILPQKGDPKPTTSPKSKKQSFTLTTSTPVEQQAKAIGQVLLHEIWKLQKNDATYIDPLQDVMVLTPQKAGAAGKHQINLHLQNLLNPPSPQKTEFSAKFQKNGKNIPEGWTYRTGDKVMIVENMKERNTVNGEIGILTAIEKYDLVIHSGPKEIRIPKSEAHHLVEPAFAITVHKSQGGEAPFVIVLLNDECPTQLRQRSLLYTAVTRAQNHCWILGSEKAIQETLNNTTQNLRRTGLIPALKRNQEPKIDRILVGKKSPNTVESLQKRFPDTKIKRGTQEKTTVSGVWATTPHIAKAIKRELENELNPPNPPPNRGLISQLLHGIFPH
jgi:exodeoxyribonuclease V alpha subunit